MTRPPRRRDREGAVMFLALATLAIVAAIAAAMLQGALVARRHLRGERDMLQVEYLLDMAVARAAGATGSTVAEVASAAIVGSGSARIATTVAPQVGGARRVAVVVEYPLEGPVTIRRRREVVLPPAEPPASPLPSAEEPAP